MKRLLKRENSIKDKLSDLDKIIGDIYYYDNVSSTMDIAFSIEESKLKENSLIIADEQTEGRGRYSRKWYSDENDLLFSFILKGYDFKVPYSIIASYAVYKSFLKYTNRVKLKWINDILWENSKKISGVITEEKNNRTVIGVGVNLNSKKFPSAIQDSATSYYIETGRRIDKDDFLTEIIGNIILLLKRVRKNELKEILMEWEEDSRIKNRKVKIVNDNGEFSGIVKGINHNNGALIVENNGKIKEFYDGSLFYTIF